MMLFTTITDAMQQMLDSVKTVSQWGIWIIPNAMKTKCMYADMTMKNKMQADIMSNRLAEEAGMKFIN